MKRRELPVPGAVEADGVELIRVWAADGKQHVTLATEVWEDPAAWGIMLADLARHIASAYEQTSSQPYAASLKRIREGFDAEWEHATDEQSGGLLD